MIRKYKSAVIKWVNQNHSAIRKSAIEGLNSIWFLKTADIFAHMIKDYYKNLVKLQKKILMNL